MDPIRKKILIGKEVKEKLLEGARLIYDCVTTTLGPKGRNVAISRQWGAPIIVHDGVTVAREVSSDDEFIKMGVDLLAQAAQKTNDEAGDGTTTSILLAYELLKGGYDLVAKGANPMVLRREIYEALDYLKKELSSYSRKTDKHEDILNVATISSGDSEIGRLVADAVRKVGRHGLVTADEGGVENETVHTRGMEFDKGYKHQGFITNPQRMQAVVKSPAIIITSKSLTVNREIVPLLDAAINANKNIVIVGEVSGDALATCVVNKMKGNLNLLVLDPPSYSGAKPLDVLEDIAQITGGRVIPPEADFSSAKDLKTVVKEYLGGAQSVVASRDKAIIIEGKGDKKTIASRVKELQGLMKKEDNIHEKERLETRIAKLTRGVAIIKVGAKTEVEMREKIERVKDAIGAARAVLDEGIVVGGGITFLKLRQALETRKVSSEGSELLKEILIKPIIKIMDNAGEEDEMINKALRDIYKFDFRLGYEMNSGHLVDLLKEGVTDPTKVVRLALENAVSVATSVLTTEALIAIRVEKKKENED